MEKENVIHTQTYTHTMEYYSAIKNKKGNPAIYSNMETWMDLEGITLGELSQIEKDKFCMITLTCGI